MKTFSLLSWRRGVVLLGIAALAGLPLQAQRMTVTGRNLKPVTVESASIRTEITGRIAVTTFDLVFRNPNDRLLEGTFEFPLLDGQQVTGFGLDIDGQLRAAVPVEKDRGRIVFENIERRRVDPGLLEQTVGNNYRARVYPIPPLGTRRVLVTYQESLGAGDEGATYRLPLDFRTPLRNFDLLIEMPAGAEGVKPRTTLPLQLPAWEEARAMHVQRTGFIARGVVELRLPALREPQVITERRREVEYFYAEIPVGELKPVSRPAPAVLGLLWDGSASGDDRDHEREFALLDAWFGEVREVEVRLVVLRNQAAAPQTFAVRNGDWSELKRELKRTAYDGATSFDGIADDAAVDEWMLFSDGLLNFGAAQGVAGLPLRKPVHAILAAARANPGLLRGLVQRHDGEFVNLLESPARAAAGRLRRESVRVLAVETNPTELAQVFPEIGTVVRDGRVVVTGILQAPAATVRLRVGTAAQSRELAVAVRSRENPSELAARAWAVHKLTSLEPDFAANREDIRQTGREFGIVTADTSLIVLETLQDYLTYDIVPPDELRKEWEKRRSVAAVPVWKSNVDLRREKIASQFAERVRWWETKFPLDQGLTWSDAAGSAWLAGNFVATAAAARPSVSAGMPVGDLSAGDRMVNDVLELSPFVVAAEEDLGYRATSTVAGTRMRSELRDVGLAMTTAGSDGDGAEESEAEQGDLGAPRLQAWNGRSGINDRMRRAAPERQYAIYRAERPRHAREPGFFLAMADHFLSAGDREIGLRVLSNLAELGLEHPPLLRVLAQRLMDVGRPELALPLLERLLALRPEEPQSRRDLALACAALGQNQRAVNLLWSIISESDTSRFTEIELTVLGEMNAIIARSASALDLAGVDPRFRRNLPVGLRVVLSWDSDACDIDLWVDDPTGERVMYNHQHSRQGGRISRDFTQGYGPEEFLLRDPQPGKYAVRIDYFGESSATVLGPVTAQVQVFTHYGTPQQAERRFTVTLDKQKDQQLVGTFEMPAPTASTAPVAAGSPRPSASD